jgi:hypothetical protein
VRGWGTGDAIPDTPAFINYGAGEDDSLHPPTTHQANFRRLSNKPPMPVAVRQAVTLDDLPPEPAAEGPKEATPPPPPPAKTPEPATQAPKDVPSDGLQRLALNDNPVPVPSAATTTASADSSKPGFSGLVLPALGESFEESSSKAFGEMTPAASASPANRGGPPSPSARDVADEMDPMARALAELRRDPPGPRSVRRQQSTRRADSLYSNSGSIRSNNNAPAASNVSARGASPAPNATGPNRTTTPGYQPGHVVRGSVDTTLVPPAAGHTAAQLAKSMAEFENRSTSANRNSVNYAAVGDSIVGSHPSRPSSPAPSVGARSPSPAMMQPPTQPGAHIADTVLPQYGQAFPGERAREARSRPSSVYSNRSRAPSVNEQAGGREGFVGIGAGGARSPSPAPPSVTSPPAKHGSLGPQNVGIALDQHGGVAHDSMAEAYRRQYQDQQQQQRQASPAPPVQQAQQQQAPYTDPRMSPFQPAQQAQQAQGYQPPQQYGAQPQAQQQHGQRPSYDSQAGGGGGVSRQSYDARYDASQPAQGQPPYHQQQQQQYPGYQQPPPQDQYGQYPQPPQQQQTHSARGSYDSGFPQAQPQAPLPAGQAPYYNAPQNGYGQQQQQQQQQQQPAMQGRTPSPHPPPGVGAPQPGAPGAPIPVGVGGDQLRTASDQPVLFYVRAMYDYTARGESEFDFQVDDIIAVTATPDDGWWTGELLDEARRVPGRTEFPSNL